MPPLPPRPDPRCCRCSPPPRLPTGFRGFFMPQPSSRACSGRAAPSTAGRCARQWRRRSAPRMPRAPGPGRMLTKPPRRRRCCSCANSAGPCEPRRVSAAAMLEMLTRLAERLPSQTRRSEESNRFQQFSTPIAFGLAAAEAAAITPDDLVLEPSAGTGLLAIFAELADAGLALNEIADTRAGLLGPSLPRLRRHKAQRRAYPRSARSGGHGRASC